MVLTSGVSSVTYLRLLTKFGIKVKQNRIAGTLLNTLADFVKDKKQKVVLNCQNSQWVIVEAGVPQGSILRPLLFLIYINDLFENLVLNPKLFTADTSHFSVKLDKDLSAKNLTDDLSMINNWENKF